MPLATIQAGHRNFGWKKQGMDAIEIQVRDHGPGIPDDRIKTIWEPYMTTKPGGTGLGLAIARQAILAHDGSIDFRCPPGGGTVVTFVLPTQRPPAA